MVSRIKLVEKQEVQAAVVPLYEELERTRGGSVPNLFKAFGYNEKMLAPTIGVAGFVTIESRVPVVYKQIAYLAASRLNNCEYCLVRHATAARKAGLREDQIAALHQIGDLAENRAFDQKEKLIIRYAEEITSRATCDPSVFAAMSGTFDDEEMAELTFVVAGANFFNRLVGALGIELEPSFKK